MSQVKLSPREVVQRGKEWYEKEIRAKVDEEKDRGKPLVIDVFTGEYEIDEDELAAADRVFARNPGAELYFMRIGFPAFAKMGGSWGAFKG